MFAIDFRGTENQFSKHAPYIVQHKPINASFISLRLL
jgi:hypothetical protein